MYRFNAWILKAGCRGQLAEKYQFKFSCLLLVFLIIEAHQIRVSRNERALIHVITTPEGDNLTPRSTMVFTIPPRGRPPTRSATIPVRSLGSKLPVARRLSAAFPIPRKSGTPPEGASTTAISDEKQNAKDAGRDVRLVITRLADSVIKRHSSASTDGVGRGGAPRRIKVDSSAQSVEQALKSVPTLEDPPPANVGTQPIVLREYQIPNSNTAGSYASVATGPVPLDGPDRCTVETVLNDATPRPAPGAPRKKQSVVSRLLHRTHASSRSKAAKKGDEAAVECAPKSTESKPSTCRSRSPSVVMLKELEVEYTKSLGSQPAEEKVDVATAPTKQESDDFLESSNKTANSAGGWSLGCARGEAETICEKIDVSGLVSSFTASVFGVVERLTKKESPDCEPQYNETLPARDSSIQADAPELDHVPQQEPSLVSVASVVRSGSQTLPSFPEALLKAATEQDEGATTEEERADADLQMLEVPTFLTEPLPTNSILQGEFMSTASVPCADDDHGLEARDSDERMEVRDGAADFLERVDSPVALAEAEASVQGASKGLNQVSKVKIVPLFGFMSGVIGQCYFVSLSPENVTNSEDDALAPEQRLLRFLEAAASCQPDQLPQQDHLTARELVDAPSPVDAAVGDPPSKELATQSVSVGSIGLLRREGDEFFVDPLPGFNQISVESNPTLPIEGSTPVSSGFQSLGWGDAKKTWDVRASALAYDAKQTLDSVLRNFTKQPHGGVGSDELVGFLRQGNEERTVEGKNQVTCQPSLATVDSNQFLHGTYSWFAI
jgi:hypothetical protein